MWKQKKKAQSRPRSASPSADMMEAAANFYGTGRYDDIPNYTLNETNGGDMGAPGNADLIYSKTGLSINDVLPGADEVWPFLCTMIISNTRVRDYSMVTLTKKPLSKLWNEKDGENVSFYLCTVRIIYISALLSENGIKNE
jgi:hypothetical protein